MLGCNAVVLTLLLCFAVQVAAGVGLEEAGAALAAAEVRNACG
jgi:hypothetical protein